MFRINHSVQSVRARATTLLRSVLVNDALLQRRESRQRRLNAFRGLDSTTAASVLVLLAPREQAALLGELDEMEALAILGAMTPCERREAIAALPAPLAWRLRAMLPSGANALPTAA